VRTLANRQAQFLEAIFDSGNALEFNPEAFSIYQNNIFSGLTKALKSNYPVIHKLVGEKFFNAMARQYIQAWPSTSPDLNQYGENFAEFISAFKPAESLPYLSDTAKLEWAWHRIYHATHTPDFPFKKFAATVTDTENILFLLPPSSTLLSSTFPIHEIWEANFKNDSAENEIFLLPEKTFHYLLWRKHFEMRIEILTPPEWQILSLIQQRYTLSQLAETVPALLEKFIPQLIQNGWVCDFIL
jgi:hypothetical protein